MLNWPQMYVEIVLYIYLIPNLICVPACMCLFVCLLGFNIAFKHLRSCIAMMPACSSGTLSLTNVLPHRTGHDNPSRHSIQTQGLLFVQSIDVERHTGIHNHPF